MKEGGRSIAIVLSIVAIGFAGYQLAYTQALLQDPTHHRIIHLGLALVVVFLSLLVKSKRGRFLKWGLLFISIVVTGYFLLLIDEILQCRWIQPVPLDIAVALLTVLLVFVAVYLVFGKTFIMLAFAFLAYLVFGRYLPFPFTVVPASFEDIVRWLAMPGLEEGLYGDILGLSANYLFLFILFGSLLQGFGGIRFITEVGQLVGTKLRSGPAATAVLSSSMVGSLTGSTVANITITGAFTIPMMKQAGYKPEQAGAIEAAASNGGQIMPPIMGAAVFLMSGFTGIPYIEIVIAAIIPALLYFACVLLYAQFAACKLKLKVAKVQVTKKQLLLDGPTFVLPLGVLVFLLSQGYSLPFVAFWGMMTVVATGLISSIRKEARLSFKGAVEVITSGVRTASEIAILCALICGVATCLKVTGLGIMLPMLIQSISHGHLIIALLIGMVSSIILGMGVPTVAAYILVAIGLSPTLVSMGVPLLQAHLFPLIFAVFSHLTPPVAIGAMVASKLAGGEYWKTAWEAIKAAFIAFLLPFLIIYAPILILRPEEGLIISALQILAVVLGVVSAQMAASNYCFVALKRNQRLSFAIAALLCLISIFTGGYFYLIIGVVLFTVSIVWQLRTRRQAVLA